MESQPATMTVLPYTYRDANNYKRHGEICLSGEMTAAQRAQLASVLDADGGERIYFLPFVWDLPHLGEEWGPESFPSSADHPWHELDTDAIELRQHAGRAPLSVDDFMSRLPAGPDAWPEQEAARELLGE